MKFRIRDYMAKLDRLPNGPRISRGELHRVRTILRSFELTRRRLHALVRQLLAHMSVLT